MTEYIPKQYWKDRGRRPTVDKWANEPLQKFLKKHIKPGLFLMDYGAGQGRLFSFYIGCESLIAIDIVDKYRKDCDRMSRKYSIPYKHILLDDYIPNELHDFDITICSEVFLHVKPADLKDTLQGLMKHTKKMLINNYCDLTIPFDTVFFRNETLSYHNFNHDIEGLVKSLKYNILDKQLHHNQLLLLIEK